MVDFPDPLGPMIATFSPAVTSRFKSTKTGVSPYDLVTRWHLMMGSGGGNCALQTTQEERCAVTDSQEDQGHHGVWLGIAVSHPCNLARGT